MQVAVRYAVVLSAIVTVLIASIAATGLHRNPAFAEIGMILVFTIVNVVVVFLALSRTAEEATYGGQLAHAAVLGVVGAAMIVFSSWLLMRFVFPDYLDEAGRAGLELMERAGVSAEAIDTRRQALAGITPANQAVQGGLGTLITSLVSGAVVALFKRRK